jgi:hypothetical protein
VNEFRQDKDAIRRGHEFETERREEGNPGVALDFSTAWCPRHLSPFRANWPNKAPTAMVMLFKAFTADERVIAMCEGDTFRLAAVAHEHSPLCCFLGDEALDPIYLDLGKTPP